MGALPLLSHTARRAARPTSLQAGCEPHYVPRVRLWVRAAASAAAASRPPHDFHRTGALDRVETTPGVLTAFH